MKIENFRDLGGLTTQDGRKIKKNKLIRSGRLSDITKSCVIILQNEYNLKQVIDLRTNEELKRHPNVKIEGVDFINLNILENVPVHEDISDKPDQLSYDKALVHLHGFYEKILMASDMFSKFIKTLATDNGGSALFHCHHGKDRTGLGAVILLKALGVNDREIEIDYLKTIEERKLVNEQHIIEMREKGYTEEQLAGLEVLITVRPEYLEFIIKTIEQNFGSFDNYLKNELMVTEEEIESLKAIYLED